MRLHWLQHVPFEGLGVIEEWALRRGASVTYTRLFENEALPLPDELDLLVVMGGPMGVHDTAKHPWLERECLYIKDVIQMGRSVLGICLGAQLIASALDAEVRRAPTPEIGWFPVFEAEGDLPIPWPAELEVYHWHGDTFDIPADAAHLCKSEACTNQAFLYDNRVLGLQFHLEMRPGDVARLIENCANEIVDSAWVQTAQVMQSKPAEDYARLHEFLFLLLDMLADQRKLLS